MMIELVLAAVAIPWYIFIVMGAVLMCNVGAASRDDFTLSTWVLVAGVALVSGLGWWMGSFNPIAWAWGHPADLFIGFLGYVVVGCLWSVFKWKLFLRKLFKKSEEDYAHRMDVFNTGGRFVSPPHRSRPRESFASDNAGSLTGWIFHWPFSMLGVVIGDVIVRFSHNLYKMLHGLFERMAKAQFSGYE